MAWRRHRGQRQRMRTRCGTAHMRPRDAIAIIQSAYHTNRFLSPTQYILVKVGAAGQKRCNSRRLVRNVAVDYNCEIDCDGQQSLHRDFTAIYNGTHRWHLGAELSHGRSEWGTICPCSPISLFSDFVLACDEFIDCTDISFLGW